ncbi:MAG TPA: CRTAC1 family protein, partial [Capsulimonadaceae bacterium]|nr:CRTAC1 family protein [Capsulimonadaceae bacterium]
CGISVDRFVKGAVSADYDHSGRPSLYLSCFKGRNILLHNDGPAGVDKSPSAPWKFTDVTAKAGVDHQQSSFSCFFFDYDNDGWPDIFVCGYDLADVSQVAADYLGLPSRAEKARLYHNNHDGTFTDVTRLTHLDRVIEGMGINYGDLDNDGWPDFYVGTGTPDLTALMPKRMFRNHNGQYFDEVTTTGDFGHLQKGHGIAFGDINNNGQQDIFEVMGGAYTGDTAHDCLYVNPGTANHWVNLKLEGVRSNRVAIGAEICVTVATPHADRNIYSTVSPGGSFGNNPLRQEIGLGDATGIKQVTIHWPASGLTQVVKNLHMNQFYKIREGESTAELLHMKTFKLPSRSSAMPGMVMNQ